MYNLTPMDISTLPLPILMGIVGGVGVLIVSIIVLRKDYLGKKDE